MRVRVCVFVITALIRAQSKQKEELVSLASYIYIYIYTFFFFSPRLKNETGEATIVGAVLWRSTTLKKKKEEMPQ